MVTVIAKAPSLNTAADEAKRIQRHLDTVATKTKNRLRINTNSWKRLPTFDIEKSGPFERTISTDSKVFLFQDGGTVPHKIRAKRGRNLHFFWARQGRFVTTPEVNHPGTVAANWTKKAARAAEKDLASLIQNRG